MSSFQPVVHFTVFIVFMSMFNDQLFDICMND